MLSRSIRYLSYGLMALLGCAVLLAVGLLVAAIPEPDHLARKGQLQSVIRTGGYSLGGDRVAEYRLQSDSGLVVHIAVRTPRQVLQGRPLLLLMGGQETGRAAVSVLPSTRGVTVAAISYPFGVVPHRELGALIAALPGIQRGIFDTPAAALLALEFLLGESAGIDAERVELAGISFGAYLAAIPAALDDRIGRLWLIHGGGAPAAALDHMLRPRIHPGWLRRGVANYLADIVGAGHLGPEQWVGRVSPRPVVAVHASDDGDMPPVAVHALQSALAEPCEILWTRGKHVHPKRPDVIAEITGLMFDRIGAGDTPSEPLPGGAKVSEFCRKSV